MDRAKLKWRKRTIIILCLIVMLIAIVTKAWSDTMDEPIIQSTTVELSGFSPDGPPVTIALISDIHVAGPDMPPERLAGIVDRINELSPDMLLIAGDFISDKQTATRLYTGAEAIAPLKKLDDRIGKIAVPGNHDHWYEFDAIIAALEKVNVTVLRNDAIQAGPLIIGGLDDDYTGRADLPHLLQAMAKLQGARVILSHSPDPFQDLPKHFGLMLAGHTHCGQIRYPWGGSPATMSQYGNRYACGRTDENGNTIVTGAGLGTSILPVRLFSRPEIWLVTIRPPNP